MLHTGLQQKQTAKLSPQQIHLMKLLQIPTALIMQRIEEELEANPALEEGDDYEDAYGSSSSDNENNDGESSDYEDNYDDSGNEDYLDNEPVERDDYVELDEYLQNYVDDDPIYRTRAESSGGDEEERTIPIAVEDSFHEYLEQQIGLLDLKDEREIAIAMQIIGSIDDDGYLRRDPAYMADDLLFAQNIKTSREEIEAILMKIQRLEPAGVGARDLQECLLLQIRAKLEAEDLNHDDRYYLQIAQRILSDCFDEFTKKHYDRMRRQLGTNEDDLKSAMDEILHLNPKPASGHTGNRERALQYIVPDFLIENRDGVLELRVDSRNVPELRVSDQYRDMLMAYKATKTTKRASRQTKEAVMFIKQKIDSAKWFIDAIRQREQTMYKTMFAIMQYQYDFFLTGDEKKIRPMILKDVAEATGLDISTVSRVANSKYLQTEFGTKRLKEFFSESLQTDNGEEVSTLEVKKILTDIIGAENKRKPLSDEKLKSILTKKGYNIARRTVAKYREQLNIPVARLRKSL